MADMAFRVIAAEPGVGVPIHGAVGCDIEGRVALLVEVLAVLGFDGGRIDRVFSEGNSSRYHENHRGTRKPDCTQELVLDIRRAGAPAHGATPSAGARLARLIAAARTPSLFRQAPCSCSAQRN